MDGIDVGTSLWTSVGTSEGDGDGWLVDGEELGTSECICVGFGVGGEVGSLVGDAEGIRVGRLLTEGLALGVVVGLSVLSELILSS